MRGLQGRVWGVPLHVFHPGLLFHLTDEGTGCEVLQQRRKTGPSQDTEVDTTLCNPPHSTPPTVSPEQGDKWPKENKRGETGYFSKKSRAEVSNYIHPETYNLGGAAAC